ncbi:MAG: undecaprenyl-diphosphatase [Micavibrio sp.]|nr:undecaprenyl-diphosphatase [Micavibrio sp.]|tara:strand:+ start:1584 stop:2396 length:813 start_codon:yes stop_codon:yes gene_type:complete
MALHYLLFLAIIQGLTEFLPVSSSGHLVLTHALFGEGSIDLCWNANRMLDVAVHVGTLLAVIAYFWRDLWGMASHVHQPNSDGFHMLRNVIIASIPVILIGFIINKIEPSLLCMLEVMAWMMLIFGIVLWVADKFGKTNKKLERMTALQAFWIGLSQSIALIPGTSRSGITMATARFLGFNRVDAARFSLLLSIIAIAGAGTLNAYSVFKIGDLEFGLSIGLAILLSFITGWISIAVMMKWLKRFSFTPFAIYRVILGVVLLYFIYSGKF